MNRGIIEAVPNFSEGRDKEVIEYIAKSIESVDGVKVLNIDIGYDANRTVITFAGEPQAVAEAAFRAIRAAAEKIDMRIHSGTHPRIGATDVMPLVPISGVTLEETAELARTLAKRVADELNIPIYCYEAAAYQASRTNLAECRRGEYEGLETKISSKEWKPDFGEPYFTEQCAKSGLTVIGARKFLIAVNFNLNTDNLLIAKEIAKEVRESGYIKDGERIKGALKGVKAIGWSMEEYGIVQVSTNITDINATSLHEAFEYISHIALAHGVKVTGTELIGMVPKVVIDDAIEHLCGNLDNMPYKDKIEVLNETMKFDNLFNADINSKIIENRL